MKEPDFEKAQSMRNENVIPIRKEQNDNYMNQDPLEQCMLNSLYKENLDWKYLNASEKLMETVLSIADDLSSERKVREAEKSFDGLILKELPKHLRYAFLAKEKSKLVIIAANLIVEKRVDSGRNSQKAQGSHSLVSGRLKMDQPINMYA